MRDTKSRMHFLNSLFLQPFQRRLTPVAAPSPLSRITQLIIQTTIPTPVALIKTIQEVRALLPHLSRLSNTANLPNIDKSTRKHVIPIIGKALHDDLNAKYN